MSVEFRTVEGLAEPPGYAHVAIATGSRLVFTAGAVPLDEHGELVGPDDAEAQTEQVVANLLRQLEAGGARADDVVKTTVYIAGGSHEVQSRVWRVGAAVAAGSRSIDPRRRRAARLSGPARRDRSGRGPRLTSRPLGSDRASVGSYAQLVPPRVWFGSHWSGVFAPIEPVQPSTRATPPLVKTPPPAGAPGDRPTMPSAR